MSTRQTNRFDPDEQARTDEELDFVLRSLDDLDAERDEQQISARRYDELRAVYTAQAADLVRRRQKMAKRRTVAAPRSRRARVGIAAVAATALIVPASLAVASSGSRSTGQTITGNTGNTGNTANTGNTGNTAGNGAAPPATADAKQQVDAHPQDPQAHDTYAAQLMSNGDLTGALKEFNQATVLNPRDAVGLTYSGWIAFLAGFPDKALPRLTQAESADPTYADPHALRGIVLLRGQKDSAGAATELRRYLALDPNGPMSSQVKAVLDSIPHAPGK